MQPPMAVWRQTVLYRGALQVNPNEYDHEFWYPSSFWRPLAILKPTCVSAADFTTILDVLIWGVFGGHLQSIILLR